MQPLGFWNSETEFGEAFQDDDVRRKFIVKVLTILLLQLLFTAAFTAIFVFYDAANDWMRQQLIMFICMSVVFVIIQLLLFCCIKIARTAPVNYILLFVGTAAQSFVVGFICSMADRKLILFAVTATVVLVAILILIALFAPCDFTGCGIFLVVIGVVFLLVGIAMFFIHSKILTWVYVCLGLLVFSLGLVVNVQQLVKADAQNRYSEEDYVVAALSLYINIVYLFLMLLRLFGLLDE